METKKATLKDLYKERWLRLRESGSLVWETKNGDKIAVKNLSDKHLENAITCLEEREAKKAMCEEAFSADNC